MDNKTKQENSSLINIDKKTIFGVTALLFAIMIFAGILTQVIPTGEYNYAADGSILNGTYHEIPKDEVGYSFWRIFLSPIESFIYATSDAMTGVIIILVIILIGGTFLVLDKSGVLKYIMSTIVSKFSDIPETTIKKALSGMVQLGLFEVTGTTKDRVFKPILSKIEPNKP